MLDLVHKTLHQMPLPIQMLVIRSLFPAIPLRRYDRNRSTLFHGLNELVDIIGAVRNDKISFVALDQCFGLRPDMSLSRCQAEAKRVAQSIHADVDLGAETPSTSSQCLGLLTPFFTGAPAAQG